MPFQDQMKMFPSCIQGEADESETIRQAIDIPGIHIDWPHVDGLNISMYVPQCGWWGSEAQYKRSGQRPYNSARKLLVPVMNALWGPGLLTHKMFGSLAAWHSIFGENAEKNLLKENLSWGSSLKVWPPDQDLDSKPVVHCLSSAEIWTQETFSMFSCCKFWNLHICNFTWIFFSGTTKKKAQNGCYKFWINKK